MEYDNKIESIKSLIREAVWAAKDCHEILFRDEDNVENKINEIIAAAHLNKAISFMAAAKSLYISSYEILANNEVEKLFAEFSAFESEFLQNLRTDHSHQWTDIQFQRFMDACELLLDEL